MKKLNILAVLLLSLCTALFAPIRPALAQVTGVGTQAQPAFAARIRVWNVTSAGIAGTQVGDQVVMSLPARVSTSGTVTLTYGPPAWYNIGPVSSPTSISAPSAAQITANLVEVQTGGGGSSGSGLSAPISLGNLAAGPIGTAAATVDLTGQEGIISIAQTTSNLALTIPPPTVSAYKVVTVLNVGTANGCTVQGRALQPGTANVYAWSVPGSAWVSLGNAQLTVGTLANQTVNGAISTGLLSVNDVITISQTTADITLTFATPTVQGQGRYVTVISSALGSTVPIVVGGETLAPGDMQQFYWSPTTLTWSAFLTKDLRPVAVTATGNTRPWTNEHVGVLSANIIRTLPTTPANGTVVDFLNTGLNAAFSLTVQAPAGAFLDGGAAAGNQVWSFWSGVRYTYNSTLLRWVSNVSSQGVVPSFLSGTVGGGPQSISATTTDIALVAGTTVGPGISLAGNIVTLQPGRTYRLRANPHTDWNVATGEGAVYWGTWDGTTFTLSGTGAYQRPMASAANGGTSGTAEVVVTPAVTTQYKLRFNGLGGATAAVISSLSSFSVEVVAGNAPVIGQMVDTVFASAAGQTGVANTDIVFNTVVSGNIPLNTTTGVFTLTAGKTYWLDSNLVQSANNANLAWDWVDATTNLPLSGVVGGSSSTIVAPATLASISMPGQRIGSRYYTPTTNQTIKVRTAATSAGSVQVGSWAAVTQIGTTATTTTNRAMVRASSMTATASAGSGTVITFATEELDTTGSFTPATGVFVAPRTGQYRISAQFFGGSSTAAFGQRLGVILSTNGGSFGAGSPIFSYMTPIANPSSFAWGGSYLKTLNAGDTLTFRAFLDAVTAYSLTGNANFDYITIEEVSAAY